MSMRLSVYRVSCTLEIEIEIRARDKDRETAGMKIGCIIY